MIKKQSGFTLIEIIVVLMVIALTVGIIGLSTNSLRARNELQPFVDNLYQKFDSFEQQAILKQVELGLSIYENKIDILNYNIITNRGWEVVKTISVPDNIKLKYEITEQGIFNNKPDLNNNLNTEINPPEIIFTSGGYVTPFKLTISHPAENFYYIISSQFSGELSLETLAIKKYKKI